MDMGLSPLSFKLLRCVECIAFTCPSLAHETTVELFVLGMNFVYNNNDIYKCITRNNIRVTILVREGAAREWYLGPEVK